ncbi:MAG: efflux RND transporter permease subunit [Bacteroidota bacterium]
MPNINSARFIDLLLRRRYYAPKLAVLGVLTIVFGWSATKITFNFEFEQLFHQGNEDLLFYEAHVERFGYDNDYLTIILEPSADLYDSAFLASAKNITTALRELETIDFVFSPIELPKLIATPTGLTAFPLLEDPGRYTADQQFIASDPLLSELIPSDYLALLVYHQHLDNVQGTQLNERVVAMITKEGLSYRLIGRIPGEQAFLGLIKEDFLVFLLASLVACVFVLWMICRRLALTLMPLLVSGLTLLWTFGLMGLLGIPISIMSSLLPPIILFVSSSDTIHLISALRNSADRRQAIEKVFFPTFMTSITTAVGFFSLLVLPVAPLQAFGLLAGIGTLLAFVITYLLAPNFPVRYRQGRRMDRRTFEQYASWLWRREQPIALITLLLALGGAYFTSRLQVDAYLLEDLPESSEVRSNFNWADDQLGGSKPWEIALTVGQDYAWWDLEVQREVSKITRFAEEVLGATHILSSSKAVEYANYLANGQLELPERLTAKTLLRAKQLVHQLRVPLLAADESQGRISGLIPEWGSEATQLRNHQLAHYIDEHVDPHVLSYRLTGSTYMIDKSHELLARDIVFSLLLAIAMVSLVLGLYFQSVKTAFIALIPNLVPLLIIGGVIYCLGLPIQLSTSIIFALVFGIVVDDSIHFLATYRNATGTTSEERVLYAMNTAGRGIINTTMVLVSGFAILILSNFGATHYLGLFLCLSLLIALGIDFTLLPILLRWTKLKGRRGG